MKSPIPEAVFTDEGPVLDANKLLRMRGYLDMEGFREIIGEFETGIRQQLVNLGSLELSPSQIEAICHDLINFSGTLGMCELMSSAERLREFARRNARADVVTAQMELRRAGDRAVAALNAYMGGVDGG
ncbi:hypothetical protein [Hyphomicrobium sp. 99]|uniref:hypothetical protein n=1 Tax=Hyphomicrobium sp. 99 TaxID=1163419 RepID=UPI0005F88660|nr:hypothetical protein [Hyphomicrobium sp. 99]